MAELARWGVYLTRISGLGISGFEASEDQDIRAGSVLSSIGKKKKEIKPKSKRQEAEAGKK